MENLHTSLYLKITALTPVHVGVEAEKHWKIGLDAVLESGTLYVLDMEKLWNKATQIGKEETLLLKLSGAKVGQFVNDFHIPLAQITSKMYPAPHVTSNPVRPFIRSQGRLMLPGSSLKGAITSAFLHKIANTQKENWDRAIAGLEDKRKGDKVFKEAFGDIENNLMRFIQVGDGYFVKSQLENTRIQTVDTQKMQAGWKDNNFDTYLESMPKRESTVIRLNVAEKALDMVLAAVLKRRKEIQTLKESRPQSNRVLKEIKLNQNHTILFDKTKKAPDHLLQTLGNYTKAHLQREKAYFEKFKPNEVPTALAEINRLLSLIESGKTILRLGMGSGFHAMTGDWRYVDHVGRVIEKNDYTPSLDKFGKPRFKLNGKPMYDRKAQKTRKLAFSKTDGELEYQPMGFVQLELVEEKDYLAHLADLDKKEAAVKAQAETTLKEAAENAAQQAELLRLQKEASALAEQMRLEELMKPKMQQWPIKQGSEVDAEVIAKFPSLGAHSKLFRLFLEKDGKRLEAPGRLPGELESGQLFVVRIQQSNKDKVLAIEVVKPK